MSDPQNLGLGELGQRVQAMSDPVADPRLRPYQGAPVPITPAAGSRVIPPYGAFEDLRVTPPQGPSAVAAAGHIHAVPPPFQTQPSAAASAQPVAPPQPMPYVPQVPFDAHDPLATDGHGVSGVGSAPAGSGVGSNPGANPISSPADPNAPKSGLQRALDAVRSTLPLVQKLLPLLDGNFATAISALVVPQLGHHPPAHPPQPPVNLEPVERGLAELRSGQRDLRGQVLEQVTSLKRVEDHLERVREATDRNTLEQQELVEDLRSVSNRVSTLAIVGLVLLVLSLAVNVFFLVQLQHILR